jgi:4-amino-4-deoxy-L-arabinose transferase-like glycosyltransferase
VTLKRWLPAALLAVYALAMLLVYVEKEWRPEWDSAIYLLAAQSLAAGTGYSYLGERFFLRPPGFSYALSFFVRDGRFDFAELNLLLMVAAIAGLGFVYLALGRSEGSNRSLIATSLMATSPLFVGRLNWILSDVPVVALLFASMFLFDVAARDENRGVPAWLAASLLLTAAMYLRSATLILLPGVVLLFLLRQRGRRRLLGLAAALVVLVLYAPWLLHERTVVAAAHRPSEQLLLFDYATAMFRVDPGDPGSAVLSGAQWWERIGTNFARLLSDLTADVLGSDRGWTRLPVAVVPILGLVAALIRGPTLLEWHFLSYTGLVLTYFTYEERLVLPLLPPFYAYLVGGLDQVRRRLPLGTRGRAAIAAVVVSALLLRNLATLPEAMDPRPNRRQVGTVGDTWDDYRTEARWLRDNTPDRAAIMTEMAPMIALLSDRRVYTYLYARAPDVLARYEIDYVATFWWTHPSFKSYVASRATQAWELPSAAGDGPIGIYKIGRQR